MYSNMYIYIFEIQEKKMNEWVSEWINKWMKQAIIH